jgi:ABC-type transport system involved in multi-copper enzyme maturation permease subunit
MIWFAWRQFRLQALIAATLLVALAIAFLITGPGLVHVYNTTIVGCKSRGDCSGSIESFQSRDPFFQNLITESVLLSVLIGIFWGAPVVAREFDTGTYRLAWTQSASRTRWLAAKLAVGGVATVITAGLFTLMATWWSSPLDRVRDMPFSLFDTRDIVPIGYALFAFALGVAIGAVVRRTIPAMVLTIVAFAAVRVSFNQFVRPNFATALHTVFKFELPTANSFNIAGNINPGDWILTSKVVNAAGKVFPRLNSGFGFQSNANGTVTFVGAGVCPNKIPNGLGGGGSSNSGPPKAVQEAMAKCVNSFHLHELVTYQPVSRYWAFQWYELGSYIVISALLAGFSIWWVRRH